MILELIYMTFKQNRAKTNFLAFMMCAYASSFTSNKTLCEKIESITDLGEIWYV